MQRKDKSVQRIGGGAAVFRLSTADFPEKNRVAIWTGEFGRVLLRVAFEAIPGVPFVQTAAIHALPKLSMIAWTSGGLRFSRTPALNSGDAGDFILALCIRGSLQVTQRGRKETLGSGEAILLSTGDAIAGVIPGPAEIINILVRRDAFAAHATDAEAMPMEPIGKGNPALQLLAGYLLAVNCGNSLLMSQEPASGLHSAFADHVHDLIALALGVKHPAAGVAPGLGVRAARLHAIKATIAGNSARPGLSVAEIAARHGVTPRYVHMLFESEGVTFSEFVLEQRLNHAHRMLSDTHYPARTISTIALDAGFTDVSYFNRTFRRRFGATPSEVRAATARRKDGK